MAFRKIVNGSALPKGVETADSVNSTIESTVETGLANLVGSAPAVLDTLEELSTALGNDENFATTVTTALSGKSNTGHGHVISDVSNLQDSLNGKSSTSHTHALDDLSDVSTSGATSGQVLSYNGASWSASAVAAGGSDIYEEYKIVRAANNPNTFATDDFFNFKKLPSWLTLDNSYGYYHQGGTSSYASLGNKLIVLDNTSSKYGKLVTLQDNSFEAESEVDLPLASFPQNNQTTLNKYAVASNGIDTAVVMSADYFNGSTQFSVTTDGGASWTHNLNVPTAETGEGEGEGEGGYFITCLFYKNGMFVTTQYGAFGYAYSFDGVSWYTQVTPIDIVSIGEYSNIIPLQNGSVLVSTYAQRYLVTNGVSTSISLGSLPRVYDFAENIVVTSEPFSHYLMLHKIGSSSSAVVSLGSYYIASGTDGIYKAKKGIAVSLFASGGNRDGFILTKQGLAIHPNIQDVFFSHELTPANWQSGFGNNILIKKTKP